MITTRFVRRFHTAAKAPLCRVCDGPATQMVLRKEVTQTAEGFRQERIVNCRLFCDVHFQPLGEYHDENGMIRKIISGSAK